MPVDTASLDPYAQQAANNHPALLGMRELSRSCRSARRNPDGAQLGCIADLSRYAPVCRSPQGRTEAYGLAW